MLSPYFENVINYLVERDFCRFSCAPLPVFSQLDLSQYPKKLYKYRRGNQKDFKALINDYVWLSAPEKFADKEDARVNLGQDDDPVTAERNLADLKTMVGGFVWEKFRPLFESCGFTKDAFVSLASNCLDSSISIEEFEKAYTTYASFLPDVERKKALDLLPGIIKSFGETEDIADKSRKEIICAFQKETKIYCLTESYDNRSMWENYAANYSGFAIEYSFPESDCLTEFDIETIFSILPVSYYESLPHADPTQVFAELFLNDGKLLLNEKIKKALSDMYKQIISKRAHYSDEREWRLIRWNDEKNEYRFPYVSAVFAGCDIKPHNLARLKNICRAKGIKLYAQVFDQSERRITYLEQI